MKIFLDDQRDPPDDYQLVRTVEDAQKLLLSGQVEEISIDYDLGIGYTQGTELTKWIANEAFYGRLKRVACYVHTGNPYAAKMMYQDLKQADTYWSIHENVRR